MLLSVGFIPVPSPRNPETILVLSTFASMDAPTPFPPRIDILTFLSYPDPGFTICIPFTDPIIFGCTFAPNP